MSDNSKIISALLVGAAAGTILGILFAPKSGKETRQKIRARTDDLKLDLEYGVLKAKDVLADIKSKVTNAAEPSTSNLKDEFNNAF